MSFTPSRIALWRLHPDEYTDFGHGGRASLFLLDGALWRHVGDVDSEQEVSNVGIVTVTAEGVAILVENYEGNGVPGSRVSRFEALRDQGSAWRPAL